MKKVLFLMSVISNMSFATTIDFQDEIAKTKVEQSLAYMGVKSALGEEVVRQISSEESTHQPVILVKVVQISE